jgi:thiol-disulfide isomerase/thioredoxin
MKRMLFLNKPVAYLQNDDFDKKGNLINSSIPKNKPVIIMIQANFCGYCTKSKPDFQNFADKNSGKYFFATIQGDGTQPGEKELGERLEIIHPKFRGFPSYVGYKNGKFIKVHEGGRDEKSLENSVSEKISFFKKKN